MLGGLQQRGCCALLRDGERGARRRTEAEGSRPGGRGRPMAPMGDGGFGGRRPRAGRASCRWRRGFVTRERPPRSRRAAPPRADALRAPGAAPDARAESGPWLQRPLPAGLGGGSARSVGRQRPPVAAACGAQRQGGLAGSEAADRRFRAGGLRGTAPGSRPRRGGPERARPRRGGPGPVPSPRRVRGGPAPRLAARRSAARACRSGVGAGGRRAALGGARGHGAAPRVTMAEGRRRSGAARGPPSPSPSPRRAVSVCESLDLQGVPAVRAALGAAQQQRRRPKSFCAPGGGPGVGALLGSAPRSRGGLLDFFRPRRRDEGDCGEPGGGGAQRVRPGSASFPPAARPLPADSPGFPRGGSLWGSRRWNLFGRSGPGPRRHLSALRKSFSFRLRRGHELRRSESGGLRPARLRTKSEGDAGSLHACPSKRDLLYPELGRAALRAEPGPPGGLWKLLTSRFRRRERGAGPKEPLGGNDPVLLGGGPLRALGECGGAPGPVGRRSASRGCRRHRVRRPARGGGPRSPRVRCSGEAARSRRGGGGELRAGCRGSAGNRNASRSWEGRGASLPDGAEGRDG